MTDPQPRNPSESVALDPELPPDAPVPETATSEDRRPFVSMLHSAGSAAVSVLLALIIGGVLIVLTDQETRDAWSSDPGEAVSLSLTLVTDTYRVLFTSSLGSLSAVSETLTRAAPLALMGLSVGLAFRTGLFNMGGQGQFLAGTLGAVWVAFSLPDAPAAAVLALAGLMGAACGGLLGFAPGLLKAKSGAHEVIITLMLNAIMVYFVSWVLTTSTFQQPGQPAPLSKPAHFALPRILGDQNRANVGIIVAVVIALVMWWTLKRTSLGFVVRTVGTNRVAARYAGLSIGATFIAVMTVSGALAGLAGAIEVLGVQRSVFPGIDGSYLVGGIAVALLGRNQPVGILFAALLFGAMQAGGLQMQAQTGVSVDIVSVLQALVIVFVAVPVLLQRLLRVEGPVGAPQQLSKGWGG